jgi:DNA-binding NarL/FixJ family response regulator
MDQHVARAKYDDCLGCLVWAYRAYPGLLEFVRPNSRAAFTLGALISTSADNVFVLNQRLDWFTPPDLDPVDSLTKRELEVYELLREGLPNQAIAERLVVSHSTAKVHVHHVLRKLGKSSRSELRANDR